MTSFMITFHWTNLLVVDKELVANGESYFVEGHHLRSLVLAQVAKMPGCKAGGMIAR